MPIGRLKASEYRRDEPGRALDSAVCSADDLTDELFRCGRFEMSKYSLCSPRLNCPYFRHNRSGSSIYILRQNCYTEFMGLRMSFDWVPSCGTHGTRPAMGAYGAAGSRLFSFPDGEKQCLKMPNGSHGTLGSVGGIPMTRGKTRLLPI